MNRDEWIQARVAAASERIPAQYRGLSLESEQVRNWCEEIIDGTGGALVLAGPKGTGKTGNAWTAYLHLLGLGWVGKFRGLTEVDYLDSCLRDGEEASRARAVDLLLLDDVGGAKVSDWSRSRMLALIDTRWLAKKPTIVTTNLPEDQLAAHLGDRVTSRLADRAHLVTLTGSDRRLA
jgi:DNA replication protein DnaC